MKHWTDFFDAKTLQRGITQSRNRQVSEIYQRERGLEAVVEGDTGVYQLQVSWTKRTGTEIEGLTTDCTCPVGERCKHAVAVFATMLDRERQRRSLLPVPEGWNPILDDADDEDGNKDSEMRKILDQLRDIKKRQGTPAPAVDAPEVDAPHPTQLDPEPTVALSKSVVGRDQHMQWLRSLVVEVTVHDQAETLMALLVQSGFAGWQVTPVVMKPLKREGAWGIGKRFRSWLDLEKAWSMAGPGKYAKDLRTFASVASSWSTSFGVDGILSVGSSAQFEQIIAKGLLTMEPVSGGPVTMGHSYTGTVDWVESAAGWQLVLHVPGMRTDAQIFHMDAVWWITADERKVGRIEVPFSPLFLHFIQSMPPLPIEVLGDVTTHLRGLYADVPLPPTAPEATMPVPVLRAWRGALTANEWSNRTESHDLALVTFRYGDDELPAQGPLVHQVGNARIIRHVAAEAARLDEVTRAGFQCLAKAKLWRPTSTTYPADSVFFIPKGDVSPSGLALLRATGWEVSGRSATSVSISDLGPLAAVVKEDGGWFDLTLGTEIDGQRIDLVPLLTPLLRGGPVAWKSMPTADGAVLLPHGEKRLLRVPLALLHSLHDHLIALFSRERSEAWSLNAWDAGVLAALDGFGVTVLGGERLRAIADAVMTPLSPAPTPLGMQAELRPYQSEGLAWLQRLRSVNLGGILADDMGLGKTVQVIAHFAAEHAAGRLDRPCLVVCPASMVGTWQRELARFTPVLKSVVLHGNKRDTAGLGAGVIGITTYGVLHRDIAQLEKIPLHIAVCDEAQVVKNAGTKAAQALRKLDARQRLCLTGTPLENHLGELHAQVTWSAPGLFGSRAEFDETFVKPIEQGVPGRADVLRRRMKLVLLRRTKSQVATDLPPRTESVVMVEMSARQRAFYEAIRLAMDVRIRDVIKEKGINRSGIEVIEALLRLRQVACDPALLKTPEALACGESAKLDALAEMLPTMIEDGRRILIFSQFTSFLDRMEEVVLKPAQMTWLRLDGQTTDRQSLVDRFQAHEAPLFLLSLKAGGTGLTLTAADTVILADPWWNPAVEAQAADRAHRIGQTQPVLIYRLVAAGTIEEKVLALQARKRALADALYDETGQSLGSLTAEDLAALLAPVI